MSIKSLSRLAACILSTVTLARPAFALPATGLNETAQQAGYDTANSSVSISTLIGTAIAPLTGLLGLLFVLYMIYGGWLWFSAQGDTKQVDKAKAVIFNSVIGLAIILSAYAITTFVLDTLVASI